MLLKRNIVRKLLSARCKDCKFFEAPIYNLLKEKRNTQIGCENFISYVD